MWQRLTSLKGRGAQPAEPARDPNLEAAVVALEACVATSAEASAAAATAGGAVTGEDEPLSGAAAALGGDAFAQALRLILSAPLGKDRDAVVDGDLRKLLRRSLLLEGCVFLEDELLLLLRTYEVDAALADTLSNALACALAAFARDTALEQRALLAASSATAAAAGAAGGGGQAPEAAVGRLHSCLEVAREAAHLKHGWEESLTRRQELVTKAQQLLVGPHRSASQRSVGAAERKSQLQLELDAAVAAPAPAQEQDHPLALDREIVRLEERAREIRGELDSLSVKLASQQEHQRSLIAQEQERRKELSDAESSSSRHQLEVAKEASAMDMKQVEVSTFFEAMQRAQAGLRDALAAEEAEAQASLDDAISSANQCHTDLFADADRRLDIATASAGRWFTERERAAKTLDLLEVDVQEAELPLFGELPGVLRSLRVAWSERLTLGESQRREEVEALLEKLAAELKEEPAAPQPKEAAASAARALLQPAAADSAPRRGPPAISVAEESFALDAPSPLVSPCSGLTPRGLGGL